MIPIVSYGGIRFPTSYIVSINKMDDTSKQPLQVPSLTDGS